MNKKTLNGISTNERILNLYNKIKDKEFILQPDFQRRLVWNADHKENFIETILLGYPFPEIYIADGEIDVNEMKKETLVVDGQQRLDTIFHYIEGDIDLKYKKINKYKDLADDAKKDFLNYNVIVRDLKNVTKEEIKEIFKRINSVSYALNSMEINNALYNGEYIETAQNVCELPSFKQLNIFGEYALSRMKDIEFVLVVMTTIELGVYFTGDKEVEDYVKRYDEEYDGKKNMLNLLDNIFIYINKLSINNESIWKSKNAIFTLICELARLKNLPLIEDVKKVLKEIEDKIKYSNNSGKEYDDFFMSLYQGTASKKARMNRGELLKKHFQNLNIM